MPRTVTVMLSPLLLLCLSCSTCDSLPGVRIASAQYIAFTRGSNCGPLLSEFRSFVGVERGYYIRGHRIWTAKKTLAGGKISLDRLTLKWDGDRHILVECRCQKDQVDFSINHWNDVSITYTFSQ